MTGQDVTFAAGSVSVSAVIVGAVQHTSAGGWVETARPLAKAVPEWTGKPLDRLVVPVLLDEWDTDGSVQGASDTLKGWLRRPGGRETPPTLTCRGPRLPLDTTGFEWVLEALEWGSDQLFSAAGELCRQDVVVTLMEQSSEPPDVVRVQVRPRPRAIVLARQADTLEKIARRELGSPKKWTVLRRLNPGVRAGKAIPAGTVVVVP